MALCRKDLEGVLAFVADAHDADGPVPLTTELLDRLAALVGCTYASYEENDYPRREVTAYVRCSNEDPLAVAPPYAPPTYWADESPLWTRRSFEKTSDVLDRRERERRRDEEEFNAEFRIVDYIGFRVGDRKTRSGVLHFDSDGRDFDERDREIVVALSPHVEALWRKAILRRELEELFLTLERDEETVAGRAVVLHGSDGRIDYASAAARRLLDNWFGGANARLPEPLVDWVAVASPGERYTARRNGAVLSVEAAGDFTLVMNEKRFRDSRLTARELEVLDLVGGGLSNAEIAETLWITPSTVAKHLEQAYAKLGVHSRTAALASLAKPTE